MALIITVGAAFLLLFFGKQLILLYLMGENGGNEKLALEYGMTYLRIILLDLPAFMILQVYASTMRECGETVVPMKAGAAAVAVNLIFNYLLIYGKFGFPRLGVAGAAVATVISQGVSVVLCILYIFLRVKILLPEKQHFRVGSHLYWELFSQSISMGLMSSIVSAGSVVLQYGINGLGTLVIAGHTAAPEAVLLYHHAGHGHGIGMLHVCFPEPRRKPAGACPQGHEGDRPVQRGGGRAGEKNINFQMQRLVIPLLLL